VITEAVQALAGVLLPSAIVFLLLLCNEREVLGPWRNRAWLNALASVIIAVLVLLSLILMTTTVFPSVDVTRLALIGGVVLAAGLVVLATAAATRRRREPGVPVPEEDAIPREQWTMPPLALLGRPQWSTARKVTMLAMQAYLFVAVVLLVVKAVQLAGG
jgi:amino acid transporter